MFSFLLANGIRSESVAREELDALTAFLFCEYNSVRQRDQDRALRIAYAQLALQTTDYVLRLLAQT